MNQQFTLERDIEMFPVNPLDFLYLVAMFDKIGKRKIQYPHGKLIRYQIYKIPDKINDQNLHTAGLMFS